MTTSAASAAPRLLPLLLSAATLTGCMSAARPGETSRGVSRGHVAAAVGVVVLAVVASAAIPDVDTELDTSSPTLLDHDDRDVVSAVMVSSALLGSGYLLWRGLTAPPTRTIEPLPGQAGPAVTATVLLPAQATDEITLRAALQVRTLVRAGRCDAALVTLRSIEARDPAYAGAMTREPAVAACLITTR